VAGRWQRLGSHSLVQLEPYRGACLPASPRAASRAPPGANRCCWRGSSRRGSLCWVPWGAGSAGPCSLCLT